MCVLNQKLDLILEKFASMDKKVKQLESKINKVEGKTKTNYQEIMEVKKSLEFIEGTVEENVSNCKSATETVSIIHHLENKVEDLENRSRRNNIVIHNVPKGTKIDSPVCYFCKNGIQTVSHLFFDCRS